MRNAWRALLILTVPTLWTELAAVSAGPARTEAERSTNEVRLVIPAYALTAEERETVAACLVLEAASQGETGLRGVMAVIRNRARARPELFAATVLRPRQFSAFNRHTSGQEALEQTIGRARSDPTWLRALALVDEAARAGAWHDPTRGATHFTRTDERVYWTRRLTKTVTLGAHSFYR